VANLREWLTRAITPFRRLKDEQRTEAEMRFHMDMEIEAGLKRGLSREEAERQARLRAGFVDAALDEVRDQRGLGWLDGTIMDLRHAWSALCRRPGFLAVAGGALAAAVAMNTLIFTIVDGVILRPLPYPEPERLVRVYQFTPRNPKFPVSIYNYLEDKRENRTLDGIGLYTRDDLHLMHEERAERLTSVAITDDFLPTLGVSPAMGRNFTAADLHRGIRVVMLSHTLWATRFHADPQIVGKQIRLDRENWTVVGVLPAGFQHVGGDYRSPLQGDTVSLWRPLNLDLREDAQRDWHFTNAIARLKPGVTRKTAEEDLNRVLAELARRYPDAYEGRRARVEPLASEVVGSSRVTVEIIVIAGALVLLVACLNIAALSVARVLARRRELAIRQALGGSAWRLIRAVLSESLIVGVLGGMGGLMLSLALIPALRLILPADFPRLHEIGFSWAAASFALIAALITSIVAGLVPALRQIGVDARDGLSEDSRMTSGAHRVTSLRGFLVAAEVALSCVLCFSAVLLVHSSSALAARDNGFDPNGVLTFQLALPEKEYTGKEKVAAFQSALVEKLKSIPGVREAGVSTNLPWTGYNENTSFDIVGRPARPGENIQARYQAADAGYFRALRFRLLKGRLIDPGDQLSAPHVVLINQELARRYFADTDPIGHYLDMGDGVKNRIVGVVDDVCDQPADLAAEPGFWWPMSQAPFQLFTVALRTDGDPNTLVSTARTAVESLDRELPLAEIRTMEDISATALSERRLALWLCEAFAALAMTLAAIGIYGMLTYLVEQRRREIGIRLALGATRSSVVRMVVSSGLTLAVVGIGVGLLLSPVVGRAFSTLLYGVRVSDALALIAAPLLILLITTLGSLAPGWLASQTEPMSALREQ
jgi:macrolide transport system ATP-binding/permease protein